VADTKTQTTVAAELREAAARARERLVPAATARVLQQSAIVAICGNHDDPALICRNCVYFDAGDRGLARMVAMLINAREPLAAWLESAARVAREHPQDPDYAGLPDFRFCDTCRDEETDCVAFVDGALAVARALNGTAQ
ncbi:hypothetical protein JYK22_21615, partial [Nonomuraea sp. RK-328]|nr:hypothetical protein [Nonomuraea sp. RK-328]